MTQRILIVRTSAIGDVVFASPFAAALRRSHPQAHIAWLVEPGIHELLAADANIDELILWPKGEWKQLWQQRRFGELFGRIRAFARLLKNRRFDLAIDLSKYIIASSNMRGILKSKGKSVYGWCRYCTGDLSTKVGLRRILEVWRWGHFRE